MTKINNKTYNINKTNVLYNKKFLFSIVGKLKEIQIDTWKKNKRK